MLRLIFPCALLFALLPHAWCVVLQLHHFDLAAFPEARCNDGTPSGFYYAPPSFSSSPSSPQSLSHPSSSRPHHKIHSPAHVSAPNAPTSTTWIIQQQGGGWCYDQESCHSRASVLVSSKEWQSTFSLSDGIFNISESLLHGAHKVYVPYCTSDAYVGNASTNDFGFQFRGRAVVNALFSTLASPKFGMGSTSGTSVLYSGCSAGARGALFNADHVARTFMDPNPNIATYAVLLDSAFWIDIPPLSGSTLSLQTETERIFALANMNTTADPTCLARYGGSGGQGWKCIFAQFAVPFVRSRYLLHAYLYDEFQISVDLAIPFASRPKTPDQLSYAEAFRNETSTHAHEDVRDGSTSQHALLPACYAHCASEDARWWRVSVNGVTLDRAVVAWFWQTGQQAVPRYVEDTCQGLNCGTGCP